jgi:hypothetical protein
LIRNYISFLHFSSTVFGDHYSLIGTVADAAVQVVNYQMITDLQISEKADSATVTESSNAQLRQGSSGNKSSSWSEKSKWKK